MIPAQIIAAKRDGRALTDAEIEFFVRGYADESIPDYQMSALAMATYMGGGPSFAFSAKALRAFDTFGGQSGT